MLQYAQIFRIHTMVLRVLNCEHSRKSGRDVFNYTFTLSALNRRCLGNRTQNDLLKRTLGN